jgi:hypothetical protein
MPLRAVPTRREALQHEINKLERRQENRRAHVSAMLDLIDRRQLVVDNLKLQLAQEMETGDE